MQGGSGRADFFEKLATEDKALVIVPDVAVIGVPDETWGERLKAFVVVRDGTTLDPAVIADFCAGKIASYKISRDLELVDALPRNANGKVLKTSLREIA